MPAGNGGLLASLAQAGTPALQNQLTKVKKLKKNPHSRAIGLQFEKLVDLMYTLRSENGCPWDRAQSLKDLRQYLLEETYELLQALDEENVMDMKEEMGDLLFQIVFLCQMMQERRAFTLLDVMEHLVHKMIARHPHVFADVKAKTPERALASWESMKQKQLSEQGRRRSLLQGVPIHLPALLQANLISSKVARVGFDWKTEKDVWKKFDEEAGEFRRAGSRKEKQEELGDLLFTLTNVARKNKINPEDALREANAKFRKRFALLELEVERAGKTLADLSLLELDAIWTKIKRKKDENPTTKGTKNTKA